MEPGRVDGDDGVVREEEGDKALPVAAIYGANASGKSNLLSGLVFMRSAVLLSHRFYAPEGGVPRTAFAWGPKAAEPSFFEVIFRVDQVRYEYGFVADDTRFLEEWLHAYPSSRKQTWFERDGEDFKFGEHLKGEVRAAEKITRPNSLFLSAAVQNRHEQLLPVYRWFNAIQAHNFYLSAPELAPVIDRRLRASSWLRDEQFVRWWERPARGVSIEGAREGAGGGARQSPSEAEPGAEATAAGAHSEKFLELLRAADFGIVDLRVGEERRDGASRIMVRHKSELDEAWLPLDEESHGTQQLFRLAPSLIDALLHGRPVLVDELEASLHPLLALQLVRTFNDPAQNPKNAQLIFTTHDTNLLGTIYEAPPLRRDQVWLTEKDAVGATRVYPLTDYKPRKAENLERGYLQGRYGATPFIDELIKPRQRQG